MAGSSPEFGLNPQPTMPISTGLLAQATSPGALKRKAPTGDTPTENSLAKRQRARTPPDTPPASSCQTHFPSSSLTPAVEDSHVAAIADFANETFGREILLRHNELRFIDQELAKCQAALEQLRRCHLIPYPTTCPTPQQVLDIMDGRVPAIQNAPGAGPSPQWAPPYGVVDGPYARHYAKWLIPDPKFDGHLSEWSPVPDVAKNAEGRSTRNSLSAPEGATIGRRVGRGQSMNRVSPATPAVPKLKGTQFMKRESDGAMVKLVCTGCHREDFCSVQGFINHVRISHGINYQSHEEAAKACGHVVDPSEKTAPADEDKANAAPTLGSQARHVPAGTVHPLAAAGRQSIAQLDRNIGSSLEIFPQGQMPRVRMSGDNPKRSSAGDVGRRSSNSFVGSTAAPALSMLLQGRGFKGDLTTYVEDAKMKMPLDDDLVGDDEDADGESDEGELPEATNFVAPNGLRPPIMSRARTTQLSLDPTASSLASVTSPNADEDPSSVFDSNMMDIEHSPNTAKNPPSLVFSDDSEGEDESDDGAYSEAGEARASEEEIAEVNSEYHDDHIEQHADSTSSSTKKDSEKHVTFVSPVPGKLSKGAGRKPNC